MELAALSRTIAERFGCECRLRAHRSPGGEVLQVRYDTAWLPRTWDAFIGTDDVTSRSIADFVRDATGATQFEAIEVEHVARAGRTVWLPVGTDGVVAVPAAPEYFRRTGQEAAYSPDLHTEHRFKL
jgi:hypothetical protein